MLLLFSFIICNVFLGLAQSFQLPIFSLLLSTHSHSLSSHPLSFILHLLSSLHYFTSPLLHCYLLHLLSFIHCHPIHLFIVHFISFLGFLFFCLPVFCPSRRVFYCSSASPCLPAAFLSLCGALCNNAQSGKHLTFETVPLNLIEDDLGVKTARKSQTIVQLSKQYGCSGGWKHAQGLPITPVKPDACCLQNNEGKERENRGEREGKTIRWRSRMRILSHPSQNCARS